MARFTQVAFLKAQTPLGGDAFLLETFAAREGLSESFLAVLDLLAPAETAVPFEKLLGQAVSVQFFGRAFHGIVTRFSQGPRVRALTESAYFIRYRAELRPKFWLLKKNVNCRIFQQLSVPDILKKVLTGLDLDNQIQGTYPKRNYCVQYAESDFDFACRLMEEEGIFYFFKYAAGGHTLVLADKPTAHPKLTPDTQVVFDDLIGPNRPEYRVHHWLKNQELRPAKFRLRDYHFELSPKPTEAVQPAPANLAVGTVSHPLQPGGANFEVNDYPAYVAHRHDNVDPGGGGASEADSHFADEARRVTSLRMQEDAAGGVEIEGASNYAAFAAGFKFALSKHFNADGNYVLTRVEHTASVSGHYAPAERPATQYQNTFRCIPLELPFRPARVTPRPRVRGTQTAVVVGPAGQEIFTDKFGRVKVKFPWDREAAQDQTSSCWVRVGTPWAGAAWGSVHIPRIGQEVIVSFLEGDPDQPLIVGSVYNAQNMPPYTLPDNKTQSGLKSRSTMKGDAGMFNEIRFEDLKGSELFFVQAQKDYQRLVKNDDTLEVKHDQKITVKNNRTEEVSEGDEKVTIAKGARTHAVKKDDKLTVEGGQTVEVTNDQAITVKSGNHALKINSGKSAIEAAQSIEIKVGGSSIKIEPAAITLTSGANSVKLEAAGITVSGPKVTVSGSAMVEVSGGAVKVG
jgi:type VI secretion system secreted protein VgrG